jgi:hypothetical protein
VWHDKFFIGKGKHYETKNIAHLIFSFDLPLYSQGEDTLFKKYLTIKPTGVTYLGDQNSDGYDDILLYDCNGGKALVFFGGNPMDTIPDVVINFESNFFRSIIAEDINYDGKLDIIIGDPTSFYHLLVYYGGSLLDTIPDIKYTGPPGSQGFGYQLNWLKDFDGDGKSELVIFDVYPPYSNLQNGCYYFYKTYPKLDTIPFAYIAGDSATHIRFQSEPVGFSSGDLNGDGKTDFSLLGYVDTSFVNPVYFRRYYFGNNTFTLTPAVTYYTNQHLFNPMYMQIIKDVNKDGRDDILMQSYGSFYEYYYKNSILYGSYPIDTIPDVGLNTQNFPIEVSYPVISTDFNGDGYNDFLTRTGASTMEAKVWYGGSDMNLNGNELPKRRWGGGFDFFGRLIGRVGDVNGDGAEDYCVGKSATDNSLCNLGYVVIFKGDTLYKNPTSVVETNIRPEIFELDNPYPNPFNPTTTIRYHIKERSKVKIIVTDLLGKTISTLIEEEKYAGSYQTEFKPIQYNVSSGVYFVVMEAVTQTNKLTQTKKVILMK